MSNEEEYFYTDEEWSRSIGYGVLPDERKKAVANDNPKLVEYQLNKSTGELEKILI
jgi:predicted acetyltransferase